MACECARQSAAQRNEERRGPSYSDSNPEGA